MKLKTVKKAKFPRIIRDVHGVSLTSVAGDALLHQAKVLSEGGVEHGVGGKNVYTGSTMLSIDLRQVRPRIHTPGEQQRLIRHLETSIFFKLAVMRLVRREAEARCANGLLGEVRTELEFKIEQDLLLVDIDVLGDVEVKTAGDFGHGEA